MLPMASVGQGAAGSQSTPALGSTAAVRGWQCFEQGEVGS